MKYRAAFVFITCVYVSNGWSQCAPGLPGCPPPDAPGWGAGATPVDDSPREARAVWADRWGAIVFDAQTGKGKGTVTGYGSKSAAINAAMRDCASNGAPHCALEFAYVNQCAAVAWGNMGHGSMSSATESLAESNALNYCRKNSGESRGDTSCMIVYSACSLPELVR